MLFKQCIFLIKNALFLHLLCKKYTLFCAKNWEMKNANEIYPKYSRRNLKNLCKYEADMHKGEDERKVTKYVKLISVQYIHTSHLEILHIGVV